MKSGLLSSASVLGPALLLVSLSARAQGVGIGTTAPDASAALDIVSGSRGALLPRVASTGSISSPATGLIVYQTGSPAGYYYNAGTPTSPNWQQLLTPGNGGNSFIQNQTAPQAGANFNVSGQGQAGSLVVDATGQNGGSFSGSSSLVFGNGTAGEGIASARTSAATQNGAGNRFGLDFYTNSSKRLSLTSAGNLGVGTELAPVQLTTRVSGSGQPASSGTTPSPGTIARLQDGSNLALDLGGNGGNGAWLQSTDQTNLGLTYPLQLNPNGSPVSLGAGAVVDARGQNAGSLGSGNASTGLLFGSATAGEGIASNRTGSTNQFGLDFFTSSARRLSITNGGLVGIGTSAPAYGLHLVGAGAGAVVAAEAPAGGSAWSYYLQAGVLRSALGYRGGTGAAWFVNGADRVVVTDGGAVGIGTSQPYSTLANTSGNTLGSDAQGGNPGSLAWAASQFGYVGQFFNGQTGVAANGLAVKVAGTDPGASALDVSAGTSQNVIGTPLLSVRANGQVGIGTNAPTQALDVNGSARLRGLTAAGIVTTDAQGNLSSSTGSANFVQNTTTPQTASFNVSGTGAIGGNATVGGTLGVGGSAAPTSTLQVSGTFAVGVARGIPGASGAGTPLASYPGGYLLLNPTAGNANNFFVLPAPGTCPGRIYYLRNDNSSFSAFIGTAAGSIFPGGSNVVLTNPYELRPTQAVKTVIALSDGQNWVIGQIN